MHWVRCLFVLQVCSAIWHKLPISPLRNSLHSSVHNAHGGQLYSTLHLSSGLVTSPVTFNSDLTLNAAANDSATLSIAELVGKYNGKFVVCDNNHFPNCDVYLCGTLHIAKSSCDMVRDVVRCIHPETVVIELCQGRLDTLVDYSRSLQSRAVADRNITLWDVLKNVLTYRSLKGLAMDLLAWMQCKAAQLAGNKLGEEFGVAALEAHRHSASVVLGDRLYEVTTQRIYDQLSWLEKVHLFGLLVWEVLTMSLFNVKEYILHTERDVNFVRDEIETFTKWMPKLGRIVIGERDLYMGKTICDVASQLSDSCVRGSSGSELLLTSSKQEVHSETSSEGEGKRSSIDRTQRRRLLAVVGAGHLEGLQRHIAAGDVSAELVRAISVSSVHTTSTWTGSGSVQIVETGKIFGEVPTSNT